MYRTGAVSLTANVSIKIKAPLTVFIFTLIETNLTAYWRDIPSRVFHSKSSRFAKAALSKSQLPRDRKRGSGGGKPRV